MANYAYTNMGITPTTLTDAVDDSKFGQIQALLFTVNASNFIISIKNATTEIFGINTTAPQGNYALYVQGDANISGTINTNGNPVATLADATALAIALG